MKGLTDIGSANGTVVHTQGAKEGFVVVVGNAQGLAELAVDDGVGLVADGDAVGLSSGYGVAFQCFLPHPVEKFRFSFFFLFTIGLI